MKIEQLLGHSALELAALSDEQLLVYLEDCIKLEPKPLPVALNRREDSPLDKEEEGDCPILSNKKPKARRLSKEEKFALLMKEMEES